MKILLIAPASGHWRSIGRNRIFNGRTFRFSLLSLLSVAAETPAFADVRIVDEQVQDIPWDESFDLVGITCMTALAPRAYAIADRFRARGIPVILGGMHPTLCAEEALSHADAVVVGEARHSWPRAVRDLRAGALHREYRNKAVAEITGWKVPAHHLLARHRYAPVYPILATRGCPHHCTFCAVAAFSGSRHIRRPVSEVIRELREVPQRNVLFVDDNLTADREYARSLFSAMVPLRKRWVTQTTLEMAGDEELVELAARAGCVGVFVGLESFSPKNLAAMNKAFHRADEYRRAIRILHRHGIGVEAGIVVGMPQDTPEVFERALTELQRWGVDAVQVSCFTPLPGTPQYQALHGRIFDQDWSHYDFHHVVFHPLGMSHDELKAGHDWLTREFYRPWRIAGRLIRLMCRARTWRILPFAVALNLAYYGRVVRWGIRGRNPFRPTVPARYAAPATKSLAMPASIGGGYCDSSQLTGSMSWCFFGADPDPDVDGDFHGNCSRTVFSFELGMPEGLGVNGAILRVGT